MPAPPVQDLPGFYFDREKNRYFPIKGPIPGGGRRRPPPAASFSSSSSSQYPPGKEHSGSNQLGHINATHRRRIKAHDLLKIRELHGRVLTFKKGRHNFEQEYQKIQASHPVAWKYQNTNLIADSSLEQFHVMMQTPDGHEETNILLMGSMGGSVSLYEVGKVGQHLGFGLKCMAELVWPLSKENKSGHNIMPGGIWSSASFPSSISSIQRIGKEFPDPAGHCTNALVTTLGSGALGGSVYVLNLSEPLDFSSTVPNHWRRYSLITSLDCTIWTSTCNTSGTQAAVGTNCGAALINLETGRLSWLYRTKSDIFSLQFNQSGNSVLCGLRNGSIVSVDVRQKQSGSLEHSAGSPRHRVLSASSIVREPLRRHNKKPNKERCELRGNSSCTSVVMSSAVCSLVSLLSDEQYFLGSSMDGSIELFDRRLLHRGAIQSYEGHVNSHTHLQLGVDPSETFVMSGGEDCCLRIWSIKSSELIFGERISNSILKTVCCPRNEDNLYGLLGPCEYQQCNDESSYSIKHNWCMWLGSRDGLYYMHGT